MIEIHCRYDELLPIHEVKFHPKNRNSHPKDQIERLAEILKYQGWRYPIKISNLSGCIVSGHGRVLAARHLKLETVPVQRQDYETEEQEYADLISDNSIASWSELDLSSINSDIVDLGPDFNIDLLGIKDFVVEPIDKLEPQCDEDEVPDALPEPKVVRGDLFTLGNHRLLCGDSTMIDNVERLMNGKKADMVFTDPPYGMCLDTDYSSMKGWHKGKKHKPVAGDNADFKPELINTIFAAFDYCKEILLWGADYYAELLPNKNDGSWAVWDKRVDESKDKMFGSCFELLWSKQKHKRLIFRKMWAGLWGDAEASKRMHPTQKPTKLMIQIFNEWFTGNESVVDLFGGSGSTLIACEKTNRQCFMMELDPYYCGVILDRWQKFTGKKAHREDGVAWDDIKGE